MLAPSPALELVITTLRSASQHRPPLVACPLMAMPLNPVLVPYYKPILTWRGTLTRETPANRSTTLLRQARVPNLISRQAWVLSPKIGLGSCIYKEGGRAKQTFANFEETLISHLGKKHQELKKLLKLAP